MSILFSAGSNFAAALSVLAPASFVPAPQRTQSIRRISRSGTIY